MTSSLLFVMKGKSNGARDLEDTVRGLTELVKDSSRNSIELVKASDDYVVLEKQIDLLERAYRLDAPVQDELNTAYSQISGVAIKNKDVTRMELGIERLENVTSVNVDEDLVSLYSGIIRESERKLKSGLKGNESENLQQSKDLVHRIDYNQGKLDDLTGKLLKKDEAANGVSGPDYFRSYDEVADHLGVNRSTFQGWIQRKEVQLMPTNVNGNMVYAREQVEAIGSRLIKYLGGRIKLYDEKVVDEAQVMERYGIHQDDLRSMKKRKILQPSNRVVRDIPGKKTDKQKVFYQWVYTEADIQKLDQRLIDDPSIIEQYKLKPNVLEIVPGVNGHQDARYGTVELANGVPKKQLRWPGQQQNGKI